MDRLRRAADVRRLDAVGASLFAIARQARVRRGAADVPAGHAGAARNARPAPATASSALREVLIEGADAGAAAAVDAGFPVQTPPLNYSVDQRRRRARRLARRRLRRRASNMRKAFVDFQNDVCAKDIRLAVQEGLRSIEHVKRYTTTGMATDQGKTSNMNALGHRRQGAGQADPGRRPHHLPPALHARHLRRLRRRRRATICSIRSAAPRSMAGPRNTARCSRTSACGSAPGISRSAARTCTPRSSANARATRERVGLFDASTLGKIEVVGPRCGDVPRTALHQPLGQARAGRCRYGLMLNEQGFIMDDGVIARMAPDRFHVTTTTGGAARVLHHMEDYLQTEFPDLQVWLTSTTRAMGRHRRAGPARARPHRAVRRRHRHLRARRCRT